MQFELTEALTGNILFSMEDRKYESFVDTMRGVVVNSPDLDEESDGGDSGENRFVPLPEWDSADGFRIMERFTAHLKNQIVQEELITALNLGKGVFRAFKDVLGRFPEAEKLWYSYKQKEMKRKIINWYNDLREGWGLLKIGMEPEETEDLVLEDFRFRPFSPEDKNSALELHALCENENPALCAYYDRLMHKPLLPGTTALTAESGNDEFAGFLSASLINENYFIEYLEVKPEFRGLGIGEALLKHFLDSVSSFKKQVFIDLPVNAGNFSRVLARENFSPLMTSYKIDN